MRWIVTRRAPGSIPSSPASCPWRTSSSWPSRDPLSGTAWVAQAPPSTPPARGGPAVAARGGEVVLFGGASTDGFVTIEGDTWLWNGSAWTEAHPARDAAALATTGTRAVLFGGFTAGDVTAIGDTWVWD